MATIESGRAFVLQFRVNLQTQETVNNAQPLPDKYQDSSWVFFPEETAEGTTRLISRPRNDWNQSNANKFFYGMFGAISLAMDRKTLKGIKKRDETTSACSLKPSPLFILLIVLVLLYQFLSSEDLQYKIYGIQIIADASVKAAFVNIGKPIIQIMKPKYIGCLIFE